MQLLLVPQDLETMLHPGIATWLLACSSLFAADPVLGTAGAAQPNIVVLLCDDLGYGDLGCFGHPTIKTPHLDRLASDGLKLTACYSAAPVCSPSRAGLITGRNPRRLGIYDWIPENSGIYLRTGEVSIPQLLKQAKYRTCFAGKWHLNSKVDGSEPTPGNAGFDHWFYTQNNAAPSHVNPVNFVRNGTPAGPLQGASSHLVVEEAIGWLDKASGQPFYLQLCFHEPHEPVAATEEFLALYPQESNLDRKHYYGCISQMDAAAGRLLAYLDRKGLRENTLIFFTSDNGPETLNRYKSANRSYGTPGPLRGMKLHLTEAGYRVPGIFSWPGRIAPGRTSAEPVCNLDLLPTVCDLARIPLPQDRSLDGSSLVPLLSGKPLVRKQPLYWRYDLALGQPWTVAVRAGPWKLLGNAKLSQFQLYHLDDDIGEQRNLADIEPKQVKTLLPALRQLHEEIEAEGLRSGNPLPRKLNP